MVSGRLMNTTLASPSTSWSGTSTAADTLAGHHRERRRAGR